ncbi:hypothetical protein H1S01_02655 [Heliobacterium chlorum]|uniref:Flagellar M-ring protein FliF n=1 Tax=Heliobacterium chlorum TaxID=2698 RepID=A0ABR7SZZ8_HELCL|nr:hypothetical protein [Heliobacterium chlorum]MBC9783412.1 hypothetical protein [Heliobacterium chlorum]
MNRLAESEKSFQRYLMIGAAVLALAAVIGAVLLGRRMMARRKPASAPDEIPSLAFETPVPTPPELELTPEEKEKLAMREQIEQLTDSDPEAIARVLKTWLTDDSR